MRLQDIPFIERFTEDRALSGSIKDPRRPKPPVGRRLRRQADVWLRDIGWFIRRVGTRLRGEYSSATIPIEWTASPDRADLINAIGERIGAKSYLEIGCNNNRCFSRIAIDRKVGVDPVRGGTVRATSDAFFAGNTESFDLVFVDGLHVYRQVLVDVQNALGFLAPGGVVVIHDCLPQSWAAQYPRPLQVAWNGDVWKAFVEIRTWPHVDSATCMIDHGLGIVVARPNGQRLDLAPKSFEALPYSLLVSDHPRLLRPLAFEAALAFVGEGPESRGEQGAVGPSPFPADGGGMP